MQKKCQYTGHHLSEFHFQAIREMLRVAYEVRVFLVITLDGKPSPRLNLITEYKPWVIERNMDETRFIM
jgi:hypothetical protein